MSTSPVYIVAEAGVNHNGSVECAKQLIDTAKQAGADAVKFQSFKADQLATTQAKKVAYQKTATGDNQLTMLQQLELSFPQQLELAAYCKEKHITFLSTAFDSDSLNFLVEQIKVPRLKIASGEINNAPLLLAHAHTALPILLSTGMSDLQDIEHALAVITFALLTNENTIPSARAFQEAYRSERGQQALREHVTLLHCTSEYPAPVDSVNLRAMDTLRDRFALAVGYSDHTAGIDIAIGAVACGACVIEKHLTLDRQLPGPDHRASLEPTEFSDMVAAIRRIEKALGDGVKKPSDAEQDMKTLVRKSIVAACDIQEGEPLSLHNLTTMRPGDGASPMQYWDYLEKKATRAYKMGEQIK